MFTDFIPNVTVVVYKDDLDGIRGVVREVYENQYMDALYIEWSDGSFETVRVNEVVAV